MPSEIKAAAMLEESNETRLDCQDQAATSTTEDLRNGDTVNCTEYLDSSVLDNQTFCDSNVAQNCDNVEPINENGHATASPSTFQPDTLTFPTTSADFNSEPGPSGTENPPNLNFLQDQDSDDGGAACPRKLKKVNKSTPYKLPCSINYVMKSYEMEEDESMSIPLSECISQNPSGSKAEPECDMSYAPTCSSNLEHNVPLQMLEQDSESSQSGAFKLPMVNSYEVEKAHRLEMEQISREMLEMSTSHGYLERRRRRNRKSLELEVPGTSNSSDGSNSDTESQQATNHFSSRNQQV